MEVMLLFVVIRKESGEELASRVEELESCGIGYCARRAWYPKSASEVSFAGFLKVREIRPVLDRNTLNNK